MNYLALFLIRLTEQVESREPGEATVRSRQLGASARPGGGEAPKEAGGERPEVAATEGQSIAGRRQMPQE